MSVKEEERRYVGTFFVDKWKHRKVDVMCVRVKITLPNEILKDQNFKLRHGRGVLALVRKDGKIVIESI